MEPTLEDLLAALQQEYAHADRLGRLRLKLCLVGVLAASARGDLETPAALFSAAAGSRQATDGE